MSAIRRGSQSIINGFKSKQDDPHDPIGFKCPEAVESRRKNRRIGEWVKYKETQKSKMSFNFVFSDALSTALSALYAKMLVIIGIALPSKWILI